MKKTDNAQEPRKLTPEEYRRALILERRRTMRTVRNTLLAIALLAGVWFLILLAQERKASYAPQNPPASESVLPSEPETSPDASDNAVPSAPPENE